MLSNNFSGTIICRLFPGLIPDIRWKGFKFGIKKDGLNRGIAASIFWGFYEAAEIRFIHLYYSGKSDIVELGGSMGIVTSHLASLQENGRKLITVEANPYLADTLDKNVRRYLKNGSEFTLLTKAIAYGTNEVALQITGNTTETKAVLIRETDQSNGVIVKAITLAEIVSKYELNDYTLICDIEGAEAALLDNDFEGLKKCSEIFMELHESNVNGSLITIEKLKHKIVQNHNFRLVDQHGPVVYFKRSNI